MQACKSATILKEAPTQVFSCEHCKIFKNIYFKGHLWTTASELYWFKVKVKIEKKTEAHSDTYSETYSEPSEITRMELFAKLVNCIWSLTIFAKPFISFVSQGYGYASDKTKQNPCVFFFISQKIRCSLCKFIFKFNFIFALLPCRDTITNSIYMSFISNWFTLAAEYI